MAIFKGTACAMVTAFTPNGSIDYTAQKDIIEHLIKNKIDAIVVLGTTGEPSTMTETERLELLTFTVKTVNKRVPVIAGTGCNCTKDTAEFSKEATARGADALMVVTPYYNKCTQDGLVAHYQAISDAVVLPIIAYNVPARTNVNILPSTAVKLSKIKNVVALKEASGDMNQIQEIIRLTKGSLDIYSGDDPLNVVSCYMGAIGAISVAANAIPKRMVDMTNAAIKGDIKKANTLYFEVSEFIKNLFIEVNPIPVKKAMEYLGFKTEYLRLPLTAMTDGNSQILLASMKKLGLVK